ncbi:FR47-like protein [Pedobacter westerhofensis]|uniref:FR47-like protein n=1 Tax=Pedobacter westerhofensis TaxID=425512 RepID=A0A521FM40_9SPHI|nr:GNAT family N-acetyltransferase [Pedobacter westerhofensis]SMO97278.1 FR47-like protein [Pedobacter westerhofensis]
MKHILDQPVWAALVTGNSNLAQGTPEAKYFDKTISPFVDVAHHDTAHFKNLYDAVPGNRDVWMFSLQKNLDLGPWKVVDTTDTLQMVYKGLPSEAQPAKKVNPAAKHSEELITRPLQDADIPAMLALTEQTKPGPFAERTFDFGHFQGIFHNHKLVAMAGQRLHPGAFAEISGVCTHPDFTGRGLARQLMQDQINRILQNDETPFLHVRLANLNAVKLYQLIGFEIRAQLCGYVLKK